MLHQTHLDNAVQMLFQCLVSIGWCKCDFLLYLLLVGFFATVKKKVKNHKIIFKISKSDLFGYFCLNITLVHKIGSI